MARQKRKQIKPVLESGQEEYVLYRGYQVKMTGVKGHYNSKFHPDDPDNKPPNHFFQYFAESDNWQCLNCGAWRFGPMLPPGPDGVRPMHPKLLPCPDPMI